MVDTADFAVTASLAALACHASQFTGSALAFLSAQDAPRFLGIEQYRRAAAGASGRTFLDELGTYPGSVVPPRGRTAKRSVGGA